MSNTEVVNVRDKAGYDVYIGRRTRQLAGSIWGNPFRIGPDGDREQVIEKYRQWIQTQPQLLAQLPTLRGKRLACWCAPLACHGDILAMLADQQEGALQHA